MKEEKFLGWNLFPKLVTGPKKNDMSAVSPLSRAAGFFIFKTLLESEFFLVLLNFILLFS